MKEQSVTTETANLAIEKGYKHKVSGRFEWKVLEKVLPQSVLQKWLRDKHNIHIDIFLMEDSPYNEFYYRVMEIGKYFALSHDDLLFKIYESALEVGLQKGLKLIKI